MPVTVEELLQLTLPGIKTDFDLAYYRSIQDAKWLQVATEIETTLPIQNYAFLGQGIIIEKFLDRVREQGVNPQSYLIADDVYKGDLKVERRILEDDQYGLLQKRIDDIAGASMRFMNRRVFGNVPGGLEGGFTNLCLDGQYFFDTDHPAAGGGTYSNTTSASLSDKALEDAEAAMGLFTDDKGEPLEIVPDTLVVGPLLKRRAQDLIGSNVVVIRPGDGTIGSGATAGTNFSNYQMGRYNLLVTPQIKGYHWGLFDTSRPIKPFIVQNRVDIPTTVETDMMDGAAKLKDEYNFSIRLRRGFGYGLPQTAWGSNASS